MRSRMRWGLASVACLVTIALVVVMVSNNRHQNPAGQDGQAANGSASPSPSGPPSTSRTTIGAVPKIQQVDLPAGLSLTAGSAGSTPQPIEVVDGKPLTDNEIKAITDRLTAWQDDSEQVPFRWPTQTRQRPIGGPTVTTTFPGPGSSAGPQPPASTADQPLAVSRTQPQGAVTLAPFVSITFNQPMVPVATVGALAEVPPPATIEPKVAGTWQWLGTSTVRFVADRQALGVDRMPMATTFKVTVPAGTRSTSGATLAAAAQFSFSTPAPTVVSLSGIGKSTPLEQVFVATFDQLVDPAAVLAKLRLSAGGAAQQLRLATDAEVAADKRTAAAVKDAPQGRTVAFRGVDPLPVDTPIVIAVGKGTPSAEGPRTSEKDQRFDGRTYPKLSVTSTECGWGECEAGSSLLITFSNALDAKAFDPDTVTVTPEIPGGSIVNVSGDQIYLEGATQPSTKYTVTLPADVQDEFGQKLGEQVTKTFTIKASGPRLARFESPVTTLDPLADTPTVEVNTLNRKEFRLRVFAVSPQRWQSYVSFYRALTNSGGQQVPTIPDWPVLTDRVVTIDGQPNRTVRTSIDVSKEVATSKHLVVLIDRTSADVIPQNSQWDNAPTVTWLQSTTIGLDVINDKSALRAWVTDLRDGSPMPGVSVYFPNAAGEPASGSSVTTSADGLAEIELGAGSSAVVASVNGETAFAPAPGTGPDWRETPDQGQLLWYVNDDRGLYRPGEDVSVKGWVRHQLPGARATLENLDAGTQVNYTLMDGNYVEIASGTATLGALGGFHLTIPIPESANTGTGQLQFSTAGSPDMPGLSYGHSITIADFRTPDFEVTTQRQESSPAVVGDDLNLSTTAAYYAGGPLADASVNWQVRTTPATFAPPGWDKYSFGLSRSWWESGDRQFGASQFPQPAMMGGDYLCCGPTPPPDSTGETGETFSGTTDSTGNDYLKVQVGDLGAEYAGYPLSLTAQATVSDVNVQQIAGTSDVLVHPASAYVGLATDSTFVQHGKPLAVQAIAADIDGKVAPGLPINIRLAKVQSQRIGGTSKDIETEVKTCEIASDAQPVECTFTPDGSGMYRLTATVTDSKGRTSKTQLTRWVTGQDGQVDATVQQQQLTLVPDHTEYQPGDQASVLVQSPIATGTGLLTLWQNGIVSTHTFTVQDGAAVVTVPITAADVPGLTASVEVVGVGPRGPAADNSQQVVAYAAGSVGLLVSTDAKKLTVKATAREELVTPGGTTTVDVSVTDAAGKPVAGSEFEVVVADEAVLAAGGYELPDPLQAFFPAPYSSLGVQFARSLVMLGLPPTTQGSNGIAPESAAASGAATMAAAAPAADASAAAGRASGTGVAPGAAPIAERTNFTPLAVFAPDEKTGADGRATLPITLPDNLTRYRVMVVAVHGKDTFGSTESTVTAGLPVTVRPSGPAFLNFGDKAQLPFVVQNQTAAAVDADVVLQTSNLGSAAPAGKRVRIPANSRIQVQFGVSAEQAGNAKFRATVVAGQSSDSATVQLPVYTPATSETFATYGIVDGGKSANQPLAAPTGVLPQFGGLEVSTSSTALQQLSDAMLYINDYEYDSSFALAAQIVAISTMGDVLQAFSTPGMPSAGELKDRVDTSVAELLTRQQDNGGFTVWSGGTEVGVFDSIEVTRALVLAKADGVKVGQEAIDRALSYLTNLRDYLPDYMSERSKDTVVAAALNVRWQAGKPDVAAAEKLAARGTALSLDAVAWLLPIVKDGQTRQALLRLVRNAAVEDAGSVSFTTAVDDDSFTTLQSDARTNALVLDALLTVDPTSDLITKTVSGLLKKQRGGRWNSLGDNTFALIAMRHYFDTVEATSPDFTAGVWLGQQYAGGHTFAGRSTERANVTIPTSELIKAGDSAVSIGNDGAGKLYYRIGLQTAPRELQLDPLDRGFVVSRSYQAIDDPADVTKTADGWHIKAGARVRVQVDLVAHSAHNNVALVDPLPAGLQPINPDLATTPKDVVPPDNGKAASTTSPDYWQRTWFDHQNLRDDRAEAIATDLQGGVYSYSYQALATTPGTFVAPPTRAEQIYAPETFGRSSTDRVVIGA